MLFMQLEESLVRQYSDTNPSFCGGVVLEIGLGLKTGVKITFFTLYSRHLLLNPEMSKVTTRWTQRAEPTPGLGCCQSNWEMNLCIFQKALKSIFLFEKPAKK